MNKILLKIFPKKTYYKTYISDNRTHGSTYTDESGRSIHTEIITESQLDKAVRFIKRNRDSILISLAIMALGIIMTILFT